MKKKTKSILLRVATGIVSIITVAIVGVVSYGLGYEKGHAEATDDWFSMDDWFNT